MVVDHFFIAQMFEEEVNNLLRRTKEKQPSNKITNPSGGSISKFFYIKNTLKKEDVPHKSFLEDLNLLIIKKNLSIQFVEGMWFKRLIFRFCPKLNFLSRRQFSQDISLGLVEKRNEL